MNLTYDENLNGPVQSQEPKPGSQETPGKGPELHNPDPGDKPCPDVELPVTPDNIPATPEQPAKPSEHPSDYPGHHGPEVPKQPQEIPKEPQDYPRQHPSELPRQPQEVPGEPTEVPSPPREL